MADVTGGSVAGGAAASPPARLDLAEARSATATTLMALFAGGGPISGRVEAQLDATTWSIVVRGRTLVADSAVPLRPDQVVQLALDQLADGQVRVRLAGEPATTANQSTQDPVLQRLAALGLPATAAAVVVLKAFIAAGAPLDSARIQAAVEAVARAQGPATSTTSTSGAPSTSAANPQPAAANDAPAQLIQRAAIPASALPLIAKAASPETPRVSSPDLLPADGADASTQPSQRAAIPAALPLSGVAISTTGFAPRAPTAPEPPPARSPESLPAPVADAPAQPSQRAASPVALPLSGLPVPTPDGTPGTPTISGPPRTSALEPLPADVTYTTPAQPSQRAALPAALPASGLPVTTTFTNAAPPHLSAAPGTPSAALATSVPAPVVDVPAQAIQRPALSATTLATAHALLARADLPTTPALVRLAAATVTPGLPNLSASLARLPDALARLLPHLPPVQAEQVRAALSAVPKPADLDQGPPAAERALRQAGVVPAGIPAPDDPPPSPIRLVRALAELAVALREAEATAPSETARAHANSASEAVHHSAREATADQVFKPRDLTDYDRILQLPLNADGRPLPTRVAIATRTSGGGERASWVRIDTEMSHLGPVSVRLSGGAGGPIAITLVAEPHASAALAAGLPDLAADLRQRGIVAVLRVAVTTDTDHG